MIDRAMHWLKHTSCTARDSKPGELSREMFFMKSNVQPEFNQLQITNYGILGIYTEEVKALKLPYS